MVVPLRNLRDEQTVGARRPDRHGIAQHNRAGDWLFGFVGQHPDRNRHRLWLRLVRGRRRDAARQAERHAE